VKRFEVPTRPHIKYGSRLARGRQSRCIQCVSQERPRGSSRRSRSCRLGTGSAYRWIRAVRPSPNQSRPTESRPIRKMLVALLIDPFVKVGHPDIRRDSIAAVQPGGAANARGGAGRVVGRLGWWAERACCKASRIDSVGTATWVAGIAQPPTSTPASSDRQYVLKRRQVTGLRCASESKGARWAETSVHSQSPGSPESLRRPAAKVHRGCSS